jgi:hypothetical protein
MNYPEHLPITITVSDPWEWGTDVGVGPFDATILKWDVRPSGAVDQVLFAFNESKVYHGVGCTYFLASCRHAGTSLKSLLLGHVAFCNAIRIPEDRAYSDTPFDWQSWWRGGVDVICTLSADWKMVKIWMLIETLRDISTSQ